MADYSELLTRLDGTLPSVRTPRRMERAGRVSLDYSETPDLQEIKGLFIKSTVAIRALIAERDAAVLTEREACAVVCDNAEFVCQQTESRFKTYNTAAEACGGCAAIIRARSND